MFLRIATLLGLAGTILRGADTLRLPDLQKVPAEQLQRLLSESLANQAKISLWSSSSCSIPLLEAKAKGSNQFPMPRLHTGNSVHDHLAAVNPAPACKKW